MKKFRPSRDSDRDDIIKAIELLKQTWKQNQDIEFTLWGAAYIYALVRSYKVSGFTYDQFRKEMDKAFEHYKEDFNSEDD